MSNTFQYDCMNNNLLKLLGVDPATIDLFFKVAKGLNLNIEEYSNSYSNSYSISIGRECLYINNINCKDISSVGSEFFLDIYFRKNNVVELIFKPFELSDNILKKEYYTVYNVDGFVKTVKSLCSDVEIWAAYNEMEGSLPYVIKNLEKSRIKEISEILKDKANRIREEIDIETIIKVKKLVEYEEFISKYNRVYG